jgi:hypothetical protein
LHGFFTTRYLKSAFSYFSGDEKVSKEEKEEEEEEMEMAY